MSHGPLSADFVVAKPIGQGEYRYDMLQAMQSRGSLIGTRKRDGHKVLVHVGEDDAIRMYSSGMREMDHRLDYIRGEIRLLRLPIGTVLIGELVVEIANSEAPENCHDAMSYVASFLGSSMDRARDMLSTGIVPRLIVFNALHMHPPIYVLSSWPYHRTLRWLRTTFWGGQYVTAVEEVPGPLSHMRALVSKGDWEGLVLYEADYQMTWRIGGGVPRPAGCYKLKPILEDDFIVYSDGRRFNEDGSLKDVMLLQEDPSSDRRTGRRLMSCGRLGSFDSETRAELSKNDWTHKVIQVRFVRRYSKTGKLREPAFMRFRADKDIRECIATQAWPDAEFV